MPPISPLVPSRLILNLSPAARRGRGGHHTVAACPTLRVIRFNRNLSANWSDYPRSRPSPEQRQLITDHCFLSHHHLLLLHCDVDALLLLPFPQPPTPPKTIGSKTARSRAGWWHAAALGMKCFTCGAAASPALPLSPRAFGCLHGISQAAPRPSMHCHRRPCPIPMAS